MPQPWTWCWRLADTLAVSTLDLTGGAPELNPHFRHLVARGASAGLRVIDRCNLTILLEPGQEDLAEFLAEQQVEDHRLAALLPGRERGAAARQGRLRRQYSRHRLLNALGYGRDPALQLNLVYNPVGPVLPPPQASLQAGLPARAGRAFWYPFQPAVYHHQYADQPLRRGIAGPGAVCGVYGLLRDNFSPDNLAALMCRTPGQRRLAGLSLRLRFQPDAGLAGAGQRGPSALCATCCRRTDVSGNPVLHRGALLWLRSGAGQQLRWRAGALMPAQRAVLLFRYSMKQAQIADLLSTLRQRYPGCRIAGGGWRQRRSSPCSRPCPCVTICCTARRAGPCR